jgi:hypothetical protein
MLANKWFQLILGSLAWVVWLALYMSVRFGKRDVREWKKPVLAALFVALAIWLGSSITDHRGIGSIFMLNFYGMLFASSWLTRRYPAATTSFTTLGLSTRNDRDTSVSGD